MTPGDSVPFKFLEGRTLRSVEGTKHSSQLLFTDTGGNIYKMFHWEDCCESVEIDDICGDINDIIGSPILLAEESTNTDEPRKNEDGSDEYAESFTWTFYKLSTIKGHVTIRWYGSSSGYYSESVDFDFVEKLPSKLEKALK